MPAMQGYPYAFIVSANPVIFGFDNYPVIGSDAGINELEKMKEVKEKIKDYDTKILKMVENYYVERGLELPKLPKQIPLHKPLSQHFSIFSYPSELDYYPEELKQKYKLWQVDGPLIPSRIPKPYALPKEFLDLPGKIIYISLGSVFSVIVEEIQRIIKILDKLDHKFIVSKGKFTKFFPDLFEI